MLKVSKKLLQVLLIGVMMLPMASLATAQDEPDVGAQVDAFLTRLEAFGFGGSFLVATDGDVVLQKGYGVANLETGAMNTGNTVFGIGSIAKDFTAAAILTLERDGLLHTEDIISDYLEGVPSDKAGISIQELIDHTSGLETYHDTEGDFQVMSKDEAMEAIFNAPLLAAPGTEEIYSNSGYTVLIFIIEDVSGQPFQDYIREAVLRPAGLNRTGFWGESFEDVAFSMNNYDGYSSVQTWNQSWALAGNGEMVSSVGDLYQWVQVLQTEDLLPTALKQKGHLNPEDGLFFAGGSDAHDYNAVVAYFPEDGLFISGMSNQGNYKAEMAGIQIYYRLQGEDLPLPSETISLEADAFGDFVGTYQLESGGQIVVTTGNGALIVGGRGQDSINALMPTREEIYEQFAVFSEKTEWLISQLQANNREAILDEFGPDFGRSVLSEWDHLVSNAGALESYSIVGAAAGDFVENTIVTVELVFENDVLGLEILWVEDGLIDGYDVRPIAEMSLPATTRFLPTAANEFVAFRLFFTNNPTLRFVLEDGVVTGLMVSSVNGETIATRVN